MFNDTIIDIKHYSEKYAEQINRTIISVKEKLQKTASVLGKMLSSQPCY